MKKLAYILILGLFTSQALAIESGSIDIKVTINKEPYIESHQPRDGDKIYEGDILEIRADATDPNEDDILQYQFIVNEAVKQPWSLNSSFSYTLGSGDIGRNGIAVEVTDGVKVIQTPEAEIYVFRKPILPPSP